MKLSDLKAGHTILADTGFTCLKAGPHKIKADAGGLFIECSAGHHYLDGQAGKNDEMIGLKYEPPRNL